MENKGLLFIPDISGFTRFVTQIEIEHSRNIIQELLEALINANDIDLQVSEVEGDAILFYKFGENPDLDAVYQQVEKMFWAFHKRLGVYDIRRYCQCNACNAAVDLSLKIITHYGEFTGYTVKTFHKLIGKDVIVAHQLLKNDIHQSEYWLITDAMLTNHQPKDFRSWMKWDQSIKHTAEGEIPFYYTPLSELKKALPPDPPLQLEMQNKVMLCSATMEYQEDIIKVFHAIGDFNYRQLWKDGVQRVDEVGHFLPRVGMRCRYLMENGEEIIYSSSYSFHPDHIEFSETNEDKSSSYFYKLERSGTNRTRVYLQNYIPKQFPNTLFVKLLARKKIRDSMVRSLENLEGVLGTMQDFSLANEEG